MKKVIAFALVGLLAVFAAACSKTGNTSVNANTSGVLSSSTTSSAVSGTAKSAVDEDVPANVRAALPDAQSITKHHRDLTPAQIASIEKETNTKVADKDHHSYLAFSTEGGARKQIGAATVVEADGKQMVVVYESRNGLPFIKEVRAEAIPQSFLDQFKGKSHDDKFQIGQDLKERGIDQATAAAASDAIHRDIITMQTLYGSAHAH